MKFACFEMVYQNAMDLLPQGMKSPEARAMLYAIGMQESRFEYRRQLGGPAMGFWQFESGGGVKGVLNHHSTKTFVRTVLDRLCYGDEVSTCYIAIEHNDVLACVFARLLLYTDAYSLPQKGSSDAAWDYYYRTWRPGRPHRHTWDAFYTEAWQ